MLVKTKIVLDKMPVSLHHEPSSRIPGHVESLVTSLSQPARAAVEAEASLWGVVSPVVADYCPVHVISLHLDKSTGHQKSTL